MDGAIQGANEHPGGLDAFYCYRKPELSRIVFESAKRRRTRRSSEREPAVWLKVKCERQVRLSPVTDLFRMLADTVNEALSNKIREAFTGVTLGSGIGLQQAQGIDEHEDESTCARFRASDEKEDWTRIPVSELN